jgi:hypothetical protein
MCLTPFSFCVWASWCGHEDLNLATGPNNSATRGFEPGRILIHFQQQNCDEPAAIYLLRRFPDSVESSICQSKPFWPTGFRVYPSKLASPRASIIRRKRSLKRIAALQLADPGVPHVLSLAFSSTPVWFKFQGKFCVWSERCQTKHAAAMTTPVIGR